MDDVIPRTDISNKITDKLLASLDHENWKTRQEALEEIAGILAAANHRVAPNVGGLTGGLKDRLADTNKNLVKSTCDIIKTLADDMGDGIKPHVGKLVPGVCAALTNNEKAHIKSAASGALCGLMANGGCSAAFKGVAAALAKEAVREVTWETLVCTETNVVKMFRIERKLRVRCLFLPGDLRSNSRYGCQGGGKQQDPRMDGPRASLNRLLAGQKVPKFELTQKPCSSSWCNKKGTLNMID